MGYISIQINKAKGSADTGASDHIERKTKLPHPHGRHQAEDNARPSEGNPHRTFGHARGHGESARRRQTERMAR